MTLRSHPIQRPERKASRGSQNRTALTIARWFFSPWCTVRWNSTSALLNTREKNSPKKTMNRAMRRNPCALACKARIVFSTSRAGNRRSRCRSLYPRNAACKGNAVYRSHGKDVNGDEDGGGAPTTVIWSHMFLSMVSSFSICRCAAIHRVLSRNALHMSL